MDNDNWYMHMHDGEQIIYQGNCPECVTAEKEIDNG